MNCERGNFTTMTSPSMLDDHVGFIHDHEKEEEDTMNNMIDTFMLRGERLRQLRLLEYKDELERKHNHNSRKGRRQKHDSTIIWNTDDDTDRLIKDNNDFNDGKEEENDNDTTCISLEGEDIIDILPDSRMRILRYDSYLSHQRYNDDYKHADCHFIDFGCIDDNDDLKNKCKQLIIEQQKSLGKGGLVWDAAVILADHLIATQDEWNGSMSVTSSLYDESLQQDAYPISHNPNSRLKVIELGAGTGVTGLMVVKAVPDIHMFITDLPDVIRLIEGNIVRNIPPRCILTSPESFINDRDLIQMDRGVAAHDIPNAVKVQTPSIELSEADVKTMYQSNVKQLTNDNNSFVSPKVLRWGIEEDYIDGPFDVIIAADVVSSLYDASALAKTIHNLCHDTTIVYISGKLRLTKFHAMFENEMRSLFQFVSFVNPITRHINIDTIRIMKAWKKI